MNIENISKEEFINYYSSHNREETCLFFDINRGALSKLCKQFNYRKAPIPEKKYSFEELLANNPQIICDEYNSGKGISELAKKYHTSVDTLKYLFTYFNIHIRTRDESRKVHFMTEYGVSSPSQIPEVAKKISTTMSEKSIEEKQEIVKKQKQTKFERYGNENYRNLDKFKETCLNKYGTTSYLHSDDYKLKTKQYMIENYGVDHYSKTQEFIDKSQATRIANSGSLKESYNRGLEKTKQHNLEKYGVDWYLQTDECAIKTKQYMIKTYGVDHYSKSRDFKNKFIETCNSNLGVDYPAQSRDVQQKAAITRKRTSISDDGMKLDSSWETIFVNFCNRNKLQIQDRNIPIQFEFEGKTHTTFIDFLVDGMLFEVKGPHLLKGCFDHKVIIPIEKKLEIYSKHNVILITSECDIFDHNIRCGRKYMEDGKSYTPLGININLLNPDNIKFPYSKNKPHCYYNTKVNGKMSAYEGFMDESIRWKMIQNRLDYIGGFITNIDVLRALNVTKTCKQPSWFSKSFAKDLINKYITTDTIIDPFAGWGTRHDATIELGKKYIGCDLNTELVEWHKAQNRNILLCDAKDFVYDGSNCSVLICPPYRDIEIYFEGQDTNTTECEWLDIVRKNVPNASEYVMVCKSVDDLYEQYIIDKKINKSHLGENIEYILKITNISA